MDKSAKPSPPKKAIHKRKEPVTVANLIKAQEQTRADVSRIWDLTRIAAIGGAIAASVLTLGMVTLGHQESTRASATVQVFESLKAVVEANSEAINLGHEISEINTDLLQQIIAASELDRQTLFALADDLAALRDNTEASIKRSPFDFSRATISAGAR